ncbi:MAG: hypothetical protein V3V35_07565 [Dehalococcoidia bacterium]
MAERVELPDSVEAVNDYLYQRRLTDGLPVVPPTEARVAAMVAAGGRHRDDVIGQVPPIWAPATIEKVAINSVMAGCEPAYMPAIIAAVETLLDPASGAHSIQTTTNPVGPMALFNGPIRHKLKINCGAGCFGPGAKANATIGRALRLIMLNLGGATPGDVDKAVLAWPGKYNSCCFGENEEESPWEPFHVERGFKESDSTVTIIPVNGMWPITETSPDKAMVLHHVTHGMAVSGPQANQGGPSAFEQVLVMSPVIARMVADLMPTKEALKRHLFQHARIPLEWLPPYRHETARRRMKKLEIDAPDGPIALVERWEDIIILCAGGDGGLQSCGLSTMLAKSVTRRIEDA